MPHNTEPVPPGPGTNKNHPVTPYIDPILMVCLSRSRRVLFCLLCYLKLNFRLWHFQARVSLPYSVLLCSTMMTKLVSGATNIWGERLRQICPQRHVVKNFNDFIECLQTSCLIDSTLRKRRRLVGSGKTCSKITRQNGSKFEFKTIKLWYI